MKKYILLLFVTAFIGLNAQVVTKVLISGQNTAHDINVKNAFLMGYASYNGTQYAGQIDLHTDFDAFSAIQYAHQNGYKIIVRSYTGLNSAVDDSAKKYSDVMLFMPAGSNSFVNVCTLDIPNSAVVSTGAGVDTLITGYKVEFFSIDPITSSNLSSFSNEYIAGQLAYLANQLNIPLSQARALARTTATGKTQSSSIVEYGKINEAGVVSALPVELISFTATVQNGSAVLYWDTATEINNYGFEVERNTSLDPLSREEAAVRGVWVKIGFVQGHGNSNSPKSYSFTDNLALAHDLNLDHLQYRLKQVDFNGKFEYSDVVTVTTVAPASFSVKQNFPNPFNPTTTIKYELPSNSYVTIKVFNVLGKEVATLLNGNEAAGFHYVNFDGKDLPSGIYIYKVQTGNYSQIKKMLLIK